MTTEQKAKAYDEALERARNELKTCGSMDCDAARQIFRFFPQLRESEDEKIIRRLKGCVGRLLMSHWLTNEEGEQLKTWLEEQKDKNCLACDQHLKGYIARRKVTEEEMQKESLHIPKSCKENADSLTDTSASTMIPSFYEGLTEFELVLFNAVLDNNFSGAKGSENALAMTKKVAPVLLAIAKKEPDWNKKPCLTCQEYEKGFKQGHLEGCTAGYNKAMKEMEQKEQKPVEWSEEDNRLLDFWLDVIDRNDWRMDEDFCKASREFINRLKSLRPQKKEELPKWKPSDEQMNVLRKYVSGEWKGLTFNEDEHLKSLYNDLKKLKED